MAIQDTLAHALVSMLEIEEIFKNTAWKAESSSEQKILPSIVNLIDHMLTHRILAAYTGDTAVWESDIFSCPQGGVISKLLWNLVMNDLLTNITGSGLMFKARGLFLEALMQETEACK